MSLLDLYKKLTPLNEETSEEAMIPFAPEQTEAAPVNSAPVNVPSTSAEQYIPDYEEFDVKSAAAPLLKPREANYKADLIDLSKLQGEDNPQREAQFKSDLESLKDRYNKSKEEASRRQMYAEMIAAIGNNIGNIAAGQAAMASGANVQAPKTQVDVGDMVAQVDKRFDKDYDNLLKQYKSLKGEGITPAILYDAMKTNSYLKQGEAKINNQTENVGKSNLGRGVSLINKAVEQDEVTSKQAETITNIDTTIDSIDKLEGMSKDFVTGPIKGRVERIKAYIGANEGARATMTAQLGGILSAYAKSISGTAVADQEYARLEKQLPLETDNPEVYASKLARFKDELENSRLRVIDSIARSGRNVKNLVKRESIDDLKKKYSGEAPQASSAPHGETVERNGKTYKWNPAVGKYQLWK